MVLHWLGNNIASYHVHYSWQFTNYFYQTQQLLRPFIRPHLNYCDVIYNQHNLSLSSNFVGAIWLNQYLISDHNCNLLLRLLVEYNAF